MAKIIDPATAAIRYNYWENRSSLQGDLEWLSRSTAFAFVISQGKYLVTWSTTLGEYT
jgi:hypothetical protein